MTVAFKHVTAKLHCCFFLENITFLLLYIDRIRYISKWKALLHCNNLHLLHRFTKTNIQTLHILLIERNYDLVKYIFHDIQMN